MFTEPVIIVDGVAKEYPKKYVKRVYDHVFVARLLSCNDGSYYTGKPNGKYGVFFIATSLLIRYRFQRLEDAYTFAEYMDVKPFHVTYQDYINAWVSMMKYRGYFKGFTFYGKDT